MRTRVRRAPDCTYAPGRAPAFVATLRNAPPAKAAQYHNDRLEESKAKLADHIGTLVIATQGRLSS
jgi:hypothetical protein